VVFDTNVLVAALLWRGVPHKLLQRVRDGDVVLVTSPALLEELDDVLRRTKFAAILTKAETSAAGLLSTVRLLAALIEPTPLDSPVCYDPDDDQILALAGSAGADLIVSGDNDLLRLGSFAGIAIVTPVVAAARLPT
jgi:putative PIN family toxin of toxin-antitoxin system